MLRQHVRGRNDDGSQFVQGQHDHPPLIAALQNKHDGVVLADAKGLKIRRSLVRLLL